MYYHYYLTRAVFSPTSDPGKAVLSACLPACLPACLLVAWLPGYFVRVCREECHCEHSAKPSMPIRIPSQIAVDCKSVHYY